MEGDYSSKAGTGAPSARGVTALFALAVFSSAFLIFFVQPMVGKHILPWFGGSPGVWALCLAFYQASLFAGYAYAHGLVAGLGARGQLLVHATVFLLAILVLPVLPDAGWKPGGDHEPSLRILAMLGANVALPFLLLAATGPLLQAWYARAFPGRSPYRLYAVSNVGSMAALLGFPFLVEPHLALSTESRLWSAAFVACGVVVLACGLWAARTPGGGPGPSPSAQGLDPRSRRPEAPSAHAALWIALPAGAVVLLMGVTNEMCLDVASIPFLWILPLVVYLATFVLAFASERLYPRMAMLLLFAASCATLALLGHSGGSGGPGELDVAVPLQIGLYLLLLFAGCMLSHGELYRLRPDPRRLTRYYLCISGGGALGGLAVGIGAPYVFDGYWELPLGVAACGLGFAAAGYGVRATPPRFSPDRVSAAAETPAGENRGGVALTPYATAVVALAGAWALLGQSEADLLRPQERNFFGVLRVKELDADQPGRHRRVLQSGRIDHGVQFVEPRARQRPTSYYGIATGIGLVLASRQPGEWTRIGVVGLGIGTLATYGRRGDRLRFYEVDPAVIRIARDDGDFTFLADSRARVDVVAGDARLSLEAERERGEPRHEVLVVDAFSSDSIPVHLLTAEAFELYRERLTEGGLLAVHVSNRHLELAPLVCAVGARAGLGALRIVNAHQSEALSRAAIWVVLSLEPSVLEGVERRIEQRRRNLGLEPGGTRVDRPSPEVLDRAPVWTDDYSNLLGVLRR